MTSLVWQLLAVALLSAALAACSAGDDDDDSAQGGTAPDDDDNAHLADDDDASDDDDNDDSGSDDDDDNDDDNDDDDNDDDTTPLADGIYVAKAGDDADAGTPDAPKLTIAAALAAAAPDDLPVFVAAGVYEESVTFNGELRGGYRYPDWRRDIAANETRIQSADPVVVSLGPPTAGEALLEGFTVRGQAAGDVDEASVVRVGQGPARVASNVIQYAPLQRPLTPTARGVAVVEPGEVTIESNVIAGPSAGEADVVAGLSISGAATKVTVRGNTITAGAAANGIMTISAGIYVSSPFADVLLAHNVVRAGAATAQIAAFSDGVEIADGAVTLVGNALDGGPAVSFYPTGAISTGLHAGYAAGSVLLIGNTLRAGAGQLAFGAEFECGATLVDNILIANAAALRRAALFTADQGYAYSLFSNDLFCGAPPCGLVAIYYSSGTWMIPALAEVNKCQWGGCEEAQGNIAANPLLGGANDYHLSPGSPCIDFGVDPTPWLSAAEVYLDLDGEGRPAGGGWDIGADEVH